MPAASRAAAAPGPHTSTTGRSSSVRLTSTRILNRVRSPMTTSPLPASVTRPMRSASLRTQIVARILP